MKGHLVTSLTLVSTSLSPVGNSLIACTASGADLIDTPVGRLTPDEVGASFRDGALVWLQIVGPSAVDPGLRGNWTFRDTTNPAVAALAADLSALLSA